ncbi:MAG: redoxin domain-containing protein [Acutalibacteraceae bacterium]
MKKLLCWILSVTFVLSLSACGETQPAVSTDVTVAEASFDFIATDIDGNVVRFADFQDAKVIMINFWEPWCNPCVSEMPAIEQLYTQYSSDGLVVLGVFTSTGMDDDICAVREDCGITYPLLRGEDETLLALQTEYVPTTVFLDAKGNILTDEPIIGVRSYEEYESLVKEYLR